MEENNKNLIVYEVIESVNPNIFSKSIDELIAEDNAITESNMSNETQSLDFNLINNNSYIFEVIDTVNTIKIEKTADQLIAEDNAITEKNISNDTLVLDFNIINRNSRVE